MVLSTGARRMTKTTDEAVNFGVREYGARSCNHNKGGGLLLLLLLLLLFIFFGLRVVLAGSLQRSGRRRHQRSAGALQCPSTKVILEDSTNSDRPPATHRGLDRRPRSFTMAPPQRQLRGSIKVLRLATKRLQKRWRKQATTPSQQTILLASGSGMRWSCALFGHSLPTRERGPQHRAPRATSELGSRRHPGGLGADIRR